MELQYFLYVRSMSQLYLNAHAIASDLSRINEMHSQLDTSTFIDVNQ